ncbi:MAG: LptA/OstA family protein [Lysobacterales bacterium]|jgi:lipopolysaccharide transport protein LptA
MLRRLAPCLLLLLASAQCHAAPVAAGGFEFLNVSADHASEDPDRDALLLRGNLRLQTHEWLIRAELAIVHGPTNRPSNVRLEGSPVNLRSVDTEGDDDLEASAPVMEYDRSNNSLLFSGGAFLRQGRQVLRGDIIEYDIGTDRFRARGADGITIEALPDD